MVRAALGSRVLPRSTCLLRPPPFSLLRHPPPPSLGEVPAELATLTVLFQASRKRIYLVMHRLTISSLLGLKKRVTDWCHLLNEEFVLGTERESRT